MFSDRQKLGLLFKFVERQIDLGNIEEIDALLKNIDVKKDPIVVMTGIIRITARYKETLDHWHDALRRVQAEVKLQRGGFEADRILTGLVP